MEVIAKPDINSLIKSAIREATNNNWEKAKKLNLAILNITKNNIETLNRLGISYMKLLDKENATKCFQYVLKISPNNMIAQKNINKLQLNLSKKKKSVDKIDTSNLVNETGKSVNLKCNITNSKKILNQGIDTGSKLTIKNVNCNPTRLGFIKILKKMNGRIRIVRKKKKFEEYVGDIIVESSSLKPINCPKKLVPFAIDEFPLLFILSSLIKGKSKWNGITELRTKESDRIKVMESGLKKAGIKTKSTKDSLTITGNPNLQIKKTLHIFPYNDHRVAMAFFCLKQLINGKILIHDFECVKTSFPKFLITMKKIGAKYEIQK